MNDQHDNEQTDREMLSRFHEHRPPMDWVWSDERDRFVPADDKPEHIEPTGRLVTRADLDQWSFPADFIQHGTVTGRFMDTEVQLDLDRQAEERMRFEPTDDDYVNWNEAADYDNDAPDPGE